MIARLVISAVIIVAMFTAVKNSRKEPLPPVLSNVQKCMKVYTSIPEYKTLDQDPKMVVLMIERGVRNAEELTLQLCEYLDSRGQVF